MGAFDHLEWTYNRAFEQLIGVARGEFEQNFSKNSNARGVAWGDVKLPFDWYIMSLQTCFSMFEETELRKADRTVGVNCNIFSNISSGTV